MVELSSIGKGAFSAFKMARESATFYMFIVEEAIQTMSLSVYLAEGSEDWDMVLDLAHYNLNELINPLEYVAEHIVANISFPNNLAFQKFAEASRKSMKYYIDLAETKKEEASSSSS